MLSSSPTRTKKLLLTAEQPSTGECWIPPEKDSPLPRAKDSFNKIVGGGKLCLESNLIPTRPSEGSNKTLCALGPRDPTETARSAIECFSVSCGGMGHQWPATGTGVLATADLGGTMCGIKLLGGDLH